MKPIAACAAAVAAALALTLVLLAWRPRREGFLINFEYAPACGSTWDGRRRADCRGLTNGVMPSIETDWAGSGLCGGRFGVPP